MKYLYIASCTEDGGIFRYRIENDKLIFVDQTPCDRPMYLAIEGNTLYVLLRAPFASGESGVITYRISADGSLSDPTPPVSTGGTVGCHIAVKDGDVYIANYVSGSVAHLGHSLDTHSGKGVHPVRQTAPHVHSVVLSPSGKYLLSADLGLDRIFVYDRALHPISSAAAEEGSGPRHMVFSKDGAYLYVAGELSSTVTVYAWREGSLERKNSISTLGNADTVSICAAIRLSADGKYLYVTNRGENTVAVFRAEGETLTHLASYPTYGDEPRDFLTVGGEAYAIVTDQFSDKTVLYRHKDGVLSFCDAVSCPAPLAVLEH